VKDAQGNLVQGRTRWRRFAAVVVPAAAAAGAIVFGMANGAIAAQFVVSGQQFKVSADRLEGDGFTQYGNVLIGKVNDPKNPLGKARAVAESGIQDATLYNMCQSVKIPNVPVVLLINAGKDQQHPAHAKNLLIDMSYLSGDATFKNIVIGQDASTLDADGRPAAEHGAEGSLGQQAAHVTITNLHQVAWKTTAGEFALNGLQLAVKVGADAVECFPDPTF
jgi:hypothetical protein